MLLPVILGCLIQHDAQARGPSTSEERTKVVELSRALEREPLAKTATATRQWLREWITEVPDIQFMACDDLLGHAFGDNYPYSREVNQQVLFSGAAFALEHQDKARDDVAVYNAGVEGALRMYESLLKSKSDARFAFLDDLVTRRNEGRLFGYVAKLANEKCKRTNIALIAAPIGASVGLMFALLFAWWFGGRPDQDVAGLAHLRHASRRARIAMIVRRIVLVSAAYYMIVAISLHILDPYYDPRFRFMSEYA